MKFRPTGVYTTAVVVSCRGYVKPDIVFFGEQLPDRFYDRMEYDFPTCDLLLVMGTSLVVHPFASLIGEAAAGQRVVCAVLASTACTPHGL